MIKIKFIDKHTTYTPARIFCIGRNYVEHVRELSNEIPEAPVVFLKPPTSLVPPGSEIHFPAHGKALHHEAELVILIGKEGRTKSATGAKTFIAGISLGLDLTLRDVQKELKQKGLPWEKAKAFDASAPIGEFVAANDRTDVKNLRFTCSVNGEIRQQGETAKMIYPVETLIVELSKIWRLLPGDLIFTGTPAGVGPLRAGDTVEVYSENIGRFSWKIV